ncbi:anti-sigma factor domain-containing protein [Actinoplanes sp. CA-252034]|uniref:anti-sigma factor n=1 Tax=Actinoplanes sp. CA-252034 TaxID=3239906 RepID=UPI003D97FC4D
MSAPDEKNDVHSLIGAYVLDALDDLERAAFDRHLRDCEVCRLEADELFEVTAQLADGAWSVPPPGLRDDVLAEITNTRQLPPAIPPRPRQQDRSRRGLRLVAAAAAVVAALGAGTAVYQVQDQRVRDAQSRLEAARASEARVRSILSAPDVQTRTERLKSGGQVTVSSSRLQNAGVIMLAADSAPAAGRVYQMWTIQSGAPASAGALREGQSAAVQVVEGLPAMSNVGVTIERAPESATPTAPLDALVDLV